MMDYQKGMDKIKASELFKAKPLLLLENEVNNEICNERRYKMRSMKQMIIGLSVCVVLVAGAIALNWTLENGLI